MKLSRLSAFCAVLIAITGCSAAPLEKAFEGKFAEVENNRVIFEYCQSCHVHKDLVPSSHVSEKNNLYTSSKFRETKECRTCHYIKENFFGDIERKTIKPRRGKI